MADTTALKNRIRAAIKANDNQEITGPVLQQALLDMVDELNGATETEANARQNGDSTLQQGINTERQQRQDADATLGQRITEEIAQERQKAENAFDDLDMIDAAGSQVSSNAINLTLRKNDGSEVDPEWRTLCQLLIPSVSTERAGLMSVAMRNLLYNLRNAGYAFGGTAVTSTNPGVPSENCFYIVRGAGTYTHFKNADNESIVLENDGIYVFTYEAVENNYWEYNSIVGIDNELTAGSNNLISSGGAEKEIPKKVINCYVATTALANSANSQSIRLRVIPGKKYYIDTKVALGSLYYVFTDAEGNYIGTRKDNRTVAKHIEEAPSGAYYLYVCVNYEGNGSVGTSDVGDYFDYISQIETNKTNIEEVNSNLLTLRDLLKEGYLFGGVALPETDPGTPQGKQFYLTAKIGTFTNFKNQDDESLVFSVAGIRALYWSQEDDWQYFDIILIDDIPTAESNNLVKSSGAESVIFKTTKNCHIGPSTTIYNANSLSYRIKVIEGERYLISAISSPAFCYYAFTSTGVGNNDSLVGERHSLTVGDTVVTAPSGANYLFVCISYIGNGGVNVADVGDYFDYIGNINTLNNEIPKKVINCYVATTALANSANSQSIRLRVIPGKKYYIDTKVALGSLYYVFTDAEGNYIGTRKDNRTVAKHIEEAPSGAYYLYVCVNYEGNGNVGTSDVGDYFDYIGNIQTNTTNIEAVNNKLEKITDDVQSKNIYDYSTVGVVNGIISTTGEITLMYNGFTTGLIPVLPNHYYCLSNRTGARSIRCLASDGTTYMKVLSPSNGQEYTSYYMPNADASNATINGQFKTPANAAFVQISLTAINVTELGDSYKIMLEDASDTYNPNFTPSSYEPYKSLFIKNNVIEKDAVPTQNSTKPVESGGVYEALNGFNGKKKLNVLLIGSSHGVNTISMFPVLANKAGIDIICGNLYTGSATIGFYDARPAVQIPFLAQTNSNFGKFAVYENKDDGWADKSIRSIKYALDNYRWDAIILQRGASENTVWDDEKANYYQNLLDYIKSNCDYNPRIYFNSGIANANNKSDATAQIAQTNAIMTSAKKMRNEFGIDIIPTAVAVQYARATCLHATGVYTDMASDTQHLDTGVGQYVTGCTVFEKIIKDFFNLSIRELDYLPAYSDVSGNVVNSGSEYFTAITDYYSRIGKTVAALAVQDEEYKNDTATMLNSRYGSLPTSYTVTNNLTGCSNINNTTTVKSDEVYMTRLDVDSGKTIQSVVVTMGGVDVTSDVYVKSYTQGGVTTYEYNAIRIGEITGNIVITAIAS